MGIDGRTFKQQQPVDADAKAYESKGLALAAQLIVWVPLALFAAFTYWTGTFFGGVAGGIWSLVSTVLTIGGIYLFRRMRRGR